MAKVLSDTRRAATVPVYPFRDQVTSPEDLRALIGMPGELALRKELSALDVHCRTFIAHAPFVLIATAGASGRADVSPRGDAPGFALVLDDHTVVIPDRPGNRRVDSFQNILENPHAGLLFMIPGVDETLRVNGRATLVRDPELLERMRAQGKAPLLALAVHVEEAFLQCAKALRRSQLWKTETWPDRSALPSGGQIWLDQTKPANTTVEELDCQIEASYVTNLY